MHKLIVDALEGLSEVEGDNPLFRGGKPFAGVALIKASGGSFDALGETCEQWRQARPYPTALEQATRQAVQLALAADNPLGFKQGLERVVDRLEVAKMNRALIKARSSL